MQKRTQYDDNIDNQRMMITCWIIINTFITVWGFDQHIGADPIG